MLCNFKSSNKGQRAAISSDVDNILLQLLLLLLWLKKALGRCLMYYPPFEMKASASTLSIPLCHLDGPLLGQRSLRTIRN